MHSKLLGPGSLGRGRKDDVPISLRLLAVHISDGVLGPEWVAGGFGVAGVLAAVGAWKIRDEEIPRVAVLTAAFFVASLAHVPVPPTSVHLLLNGLVGVVLGRRALLAIPLGLSLQAVFLGHGGYSTLGVNACVMAGPALAARGLFVGLRRLPWVRLRWFRSALVTGTAFVWLVALGLSLSLMTGRWAGGWQTDLETVWAVVSSPAGLLTGAGLCAIAVVLGVIERRMEHGPDFPIGLVVGATSVLLTVGLNALALYGGAHQGLRELVLPVFVAHLPIAAVEGVVLGFTVGFLARVKPELLNGPPDRSGWDDTLEVGERRAKIYN